MGNPKLKEFKIINLHSNDTNKIKYSFPIDINTDTNNEYFEEEYIGEMMEFFNIDSKEMNTLYYDITTKFIHSY